jgi:hypothetical protein
MSWKRERSNEMNLATSDDSGDNETEEFSGVSGDYGCVQEGEIETEIAIKTESLTETETTAPSNAAAAVAAAAASSLTTKGPAVTTGTTGSTNTTTATATKKKKTTTTTRTSVGGNPGKAQQQAVSATTAATATVTTASSTSGSSSSPNKKRPYIRTKRPVGYNDKSSITTATDTLWQSPLNVYDAVLSEASDLLQAATEAQQLGRLKMASAYLLLLHARLVGLGKRFDKAYSPPSTTSSSSLSSSSSSTMRAAASARHKSGSGGGSSSGGGAVPNAPHYGYATTTTTTSSGWNGQAHMAGGGGGGGGALLATMDGGGGGQRHRDTKTAALASLLPSHIELDTAMMEHLARAAAELHAARCSGRYQQATATAAATAAGLPLPSPMRDSCAVGTNTATVPPSTHPTLPPPPPHHHHHHYAAASTEHYPHASPHKRPALHSPNAREFLQSTANHRGVTNAATVTGGATSTVHPPQPPQSHPSWPPQHHPTMDGQPRQTTAIGTSLQPRQQPTLQHTQVKAEMQDNDHARPSTTTTTSTPTTTVLASSQPNSGTSSTTPIVTTGMTWSGPRCKPVTAAMNTVPHAQCNVRNLLLLPRQRFSNNANDGTRTNTTAAPLLAPPPPPRDSAKPVPSQPQTVVRTL